MSLLRIPPGTIVDILKYRARESPNKILYRFIIDDQGHIDELSYMQLEQNAARLGAELLNKIDIQSTIRPRAVILCKPGIAYLNAFFSCLYANIIAVPLYPPRRDADLQRLMAILKNALPEIIMLDEEIAERTRDLLRKNAVLSNIQVIVVKDKIEKNNLDVKIIPPTKDDLAFLQYTSGSTGLPKGVMVSHANLIANSQGIADIYGHSADSVGVIWLPPYHDMGLIGGIIQMLYVGGSDVLMSPYYFLQRPIRWLKTISEYHATVSGANDFAFLYTVENTRKAECKSLEIDLSSWEVAFVGAEKVNGSTLKKFYEKFAHFGFKYNSFLPGYGLAEATLMVSSARRENTPIVNHFDSNALTQGKVKISHSKKTARELVACGQVIPRHRILIVNPDTKLPCEENEIGEIWFVGESVARGYWNNAEETKDTFLATIAKTDSPHYLRTGDLGFLYNDNLYFAGRIKNLIIIRGRNFYANDLEYIAANCHPALMQGRSAVFPVEIGDEENFVVVSEVRRSEIRQYTGEEVINTIKKSIAEVYGIQPYAIVLIVAGSIPKTSSGKVKRFACKEAYLKKALSILFEWEKDKAVKTITRKRKKVGSIYAEKEKSEKLITWLRNYADTRINSRLFDERRCIPPYIFMDLAAKGFLGMYAPKEYGGLNLSLNDMVSVMEQFAAIDVSLGVIIGYQNVLGIRPILTYGNAEQKERWLPLLTKGHHFCAFAITEPMTGGGHAAGVTSTIARRSGHGWVINGLKRWNIGGWANLFHIYSHIEEASKTPKPTIFTLNRDMPGLSTGPEALTMGFRGILQSPVILDNVYADASSILGEIGQGQDIVEDALTLSRFGIAVLSLGAMKRSAQLIHRYASRRNIYTGKLINNPIILKKISTLNAEIDSHEALIRRIADLVDQEHVLPIEVFMAIKVSASESAWQATDTLMQLLGGRGYMENNYAPQLMRDVRALRIIEGPTEALASFIGRSFQQNNNISQFLSEHFQADALANRITQSIQQINQFNLKQAPSPVHAMIDSNFIGGQITMKALLLAASEYRYQNNPTAYNKKLAEYCESELESLIARSLTKNSEIIILQNKKEIDERIIDYRETIGDIEQSCPGEDIERDPLLQLHEIKLEKLEKGHPVKKKLTREEIKNWISSWMQTHCKTKADDIDEEISLFAYGLDSILIVRLSNDLGEYLEFPIEQGALWENNTLKSLTEYLFNLLQDSMPRELKRHAQLPSAPSGYNKPSLEQERLWVSEQLQKTPYNNMLRIIQIKGELNVELLEKSLNTIIKQREVLRSTYPIESEIILKINDFTANLEVVDCASSVADKEATIEKEAHTLLDSPFDLGQGPLFRFKLLRFSSEEHYLLIEFHHIISDIISLKLFYEDLIEIYTAYSQGKSTVAIERPRYLDYVYWQRQQMNDPKHEKLKTFWVDLLKDAPAELKLPLDNPRQSAIYEGKYEIVEFEPAKLEAIRLYAAKNNITIFTFLYSIFNVLISLFSKQEDIVMGIPSSGRSHPALEDMIGFLAYPLPCRVKLDPNESFEDLMQRVHKINIEMMKHGQMTLSEITQAVNPARNVNYNPIFQIMFGYIANQINSHTVGDTTFIPTIKNSRAPGTFDLFLSLYEVDNSVLGALMYNAAIFNDATIKMLNQNFNDLITRCLTHNKIKINEFKLNKITSHEQRAKYTINIASTFVAEPIEETMLFWMKKLRLPVKINFAPYNQIFQQLIDTSSFIYANQKGCNILLVRVTDWIQQKKHTSKNHIMKIIEEFLLLLKRAITRINLPFIICVAPLNVDLIKDARYAHLIKECENELINTLCHISGIHVITMMDILSLYPLTSDSKNQLAAIDNIFEPLTDEVASIPYHMRFYSALGTIISRYIYNLNTPPKKVVVLDCDQTLWQGVCGEDRLDKIKISYPYQVLQYFMIELQTRGIILCLCSKNSEEDAFHVLDNHPNMLLKREHITAYRINWESKTENMLSLAEELNLGLDSFVLIDDNPVECAEIRANLPQVTTLLLPPQSEKIPNFLAHIWELDVWEVSEEDKRRTLFYKTDIKRKLLLKKSPTISEFIASLNLEVKLEPLNDKNINRVAQLYLRTNQFNANPIRRRVADIKSSQEEGIHFITISAQDRFGDYGLIGVMAYLLKSSQCLVDTFILSCRILGRGVERQMLRYLAQIALDNHKDDVVINFTATDKNSPVKLFFEKIIAEQKTGSLTSTEFIFKAQNFLSLPIVPLSEHEMPVDQPHSFRQQKFATQEDVSATSQEIATVYNNIKNIYSAIYPETKATRKESTLSSNKLEQQLQEIFSDLLNMSDLDITADFFQLGGTSLKAVFAIKKISDTFSTTLSYFEFANAGSVRRLAQLLDNQQNKKWVTKPDRGYSFLKDIYLNPRSDLSFSLTRGFTAKPHQILLTGATGFVGAYLLHDLLKYTQAKIFCWIRSSSLEQGWNRLENNLAQYHLEIKDLKERVTLVRVDPNEYPFILDPNEYNYLSHYIDAVYHCAAEVNFTYPYTQLRSANVDFTRNIIDFCFQQRLKTLHFISSTAVYDSPTFGLKDIILEAHLHLKEHHILGGYAQSKWVAEQLVNLAMEKGLPTVIYRPGAISTSLKTRLSEDSPNLLAQLIYICKSIGAVPDEQGLVDFAPVDYVSHAITCIAQNIKAEGQVFHLTHPHPVTLTELLSQLHAKKIHIESIPYSDWLERAMNFLTKSGNHTLSSLLPLFTEPILDVGSTWIEMILNRPHFSCRNTLALIKDRNVTCTPISDIILKYLKDPQ